MKLFYLSFVPLVFLTTCHFWNFYPDTDDPGLTRFNSRGSNSVSFYLNDKPYLNMGNTDDSLLFKTASGSSSSVLNFSWHFFSNESPFSNKSLYTKISFQLPVAAGFTSSNLLNLNGQRFSNSIPFTLQDSAFNITTGISNLYFVSVSNVTYGSNQQFIKLSGLFDGKIGDSVIVSKGRFDFQIDKSKLNF